MAGLQALISTHPGNVLVACKSHRCYSCHHRLCCRRHNLPLRRHPEFAAHLPFDEVQARLDLRCVLAGEPHRSARRHHGRQRHQRQHKGPVHSAAAPHVSLGHVAGNNRCAAALQGQPFRRQKYLRWWQGDLAATITPTATAAASSADRQAPFEMFPNFVDCSAACQPRLPPACGGDLADKRLAQEARVAWAQRQHAAIECETLQACDRQL